MSKTNNVNKQPRRDIPKCKGTLKFIPYVLNISSLNEL